MNPRQLKRYTIQDVDTKQIYIVEAYNSKEAFRQGFKLAYRYGEIELSIINTEPVKK